MIQARRFWHHSLSLATLIVTLCAVWVAVVRVQKEFFPTVRVAATDTMTVRDWRAYGEEGVRMGPATAAVTIVEFGDFLCPLCAAASEYLKELRGRYPNEVAVVFRHFPIDQISFNAAMASQCAAGVGAFEAYHDLLFAQSDSLGEKPWTAFAEEAGMADTVHFAECLQDSAVMNLISRDTMAATELDVRGTPTVLINDLLVTGFLRRARMDEFVQDALEDDIAG